tara:strand:+ start:383 stop:574 length:192 start_codon:yes stop_codon:yes gene_type:complete
LSKYFKENVVVAVYVNTIVMHEPLIAAKQSNIPSIVHVRELPEYDPDLMERYLAKLRRNVENG